MNVIVQTLSPDAAAGYLMIGGHRFDCTLGKSGVTADKREGDGKTPVGTYPVRQLLYRPDRMERPETALPIEPITDATGWCEDPAHADYNKKVALPHPAACDRMKRDDALYDLCLVIGYNDNPPVPPSGSAIFMHLARDDFSGTAGCIGLKADDLRLVLSLLQPDSTVTILPPPDPLTV